MHRPNTLQAAWPQQGPWAFPSPLEELPPDRQCPASRDTRQAVPSQQGHVRLQPLTPAQRPLHITPQCRAQAEHGRRVCRAGLGRRKGMRDRRGEAEQELGPRSARACLAPQSARPCGGNSGSCAQAWAEHRQSPRGAAGRSKSGGDGSRARGSGAGPARGPSMDVPPSMGEGPPGPGRAEQQRAGGGEHGADGASTAPRQGHGRGHGQGVPRKGQAGLGARAPVKEAQGSPCSDERHWRQ